MQYETIILELMARIKKLEEEVAMFSLIHMAASSVKTPRR